jgi:hypothetical protein
MNNTTKKSRSFSQAKIKAVCDELCDNIDLLCETFDLNCKHNNKMITMACPIHGGDNESALNLYYVGDSYRGNWVCRTHHCERIFQPSIIGFLRGILSVRTNNWIKDGDEMYSFDNTMQMALKILNKDIKDIKVNYTNMEKKAFIKNIQSISHIPDSLDKLPTRQMVRKALDIPANYYLKRGYSQKILDKYDVGQCTNSNKEMFDRIVVPIYNQQYSHMVGCSGRSIYEKCSKCSYYHNPNTDCINSEFGWKYSKWKHNKDFKAKDHLYNLWFAKDYILKTGIAVVVESPGNVWRLEEAGIHNSIAIFGTSLGDRQKMLLDCSGAMSLLILLDNDEAGQVGAKQIYDKCYRTYNIKTLSIIKNDIADMTIEDIQQTIIPEMDKMHV